MKVKDLIKPADIVFIFAYVVVTVLGNIFLRLTLSYLNETIPVLMEQCTLFFE